MMSQITADAPSAGGPHDRSGRMTAATHAERPGATKAAI
jgi:hypothetical protein